MEYWVSVNQQAFDPDLFAIQSADPVNPGACHDGVNVIYTWIAPEVEAAAFVLPEGAEVTKGVIGGRMAKYPATPIIAPRSVWEQLFRTPEFRLWCGSYEDDDQFNADKTEVGLPITMTQLESREAMLNLFKGDGNA